MDMPKPKIILYRICMALGIIWSLSAAIWEYRIENYFEAIILALFAVVLIWHTIKKWHKPDWGQMAYLGFSFVFLSFFYLRRDYVKHQNKLRLDKFGPPLNARRVKLGIPVIPVNWQADYIDDQYAKWSKKDSTIGHQSKRIFLDSLHRLDWEEDDYNLKRADSVDRYVNIRTNYSKSGSVDSTDYRYEARMNNKTISRSQADSIFKAEKIQKDY